MIEMRNRLVAGYSNLKKVTLTELLKTNRHDEHEFHLLQKNHFHYDPGRFFFSGLQGPGS